ncbi:MULTISPECIES: ABC transporter permease [Brevibacillus]|uniref:ABC transporter permease n=1 Tax=Brevibacillus parabrevis TaxID=54914 RepID=A0A4Y3PG25_BREPA|nr:MULTISPECIES: ABC transporter permease [Brevibacillus]MBU8712478.1 ABC transporter permease [Brevibacillus parabrevis]MDR5002420.1 ABC transporter permease [Brevibacillus parabrevis]NRQ52576.1 ABC transporter permease [Brevibacillus sp. HD1.4A]RNB95984.1 ABC transporter permease [Brevibacillus parabrevis]UED71765.1 ABC transporter permease [Brevibacillus sp. HD3.3A]
MSRGIWFGISIAIFFAAWEAVCRIFAVPPFILPPPSTVVVALWDLRESLLGVHLWATLKEVLLGLSVSIVFGVLLAFAMSMSKLIERLVYPYIVISQTIPIIALSPVFILWFGYDLSGKIAVTILFTFFPIVVNTYDGLRSTDQEMLQLIKTMGANRWQIFTKLQLPSCLPHFFSGLKVAATYSVAGATIGEWLGASEGLGYFGRRASGNFQAPALFASVLLLSVLGMLLFWLVGRIERQLSPHTKNKHQSSK